MWPKQNFSLQYQQNIKQTSDENKEKYQLEDYKFIQYQILQTNIIIIVWKSVRRITDDILGVEGFTLLINLGIYNHHGDISQCSATDISSNNVHEIFIRFWLAENECILM